LVLEGSKLGLLVRGNHKDDKTKGQRPLVKMENEKWKMINRGFNLEVQQQLKRTVQKFCFLPFY